MHIIIWKYHVRPHVIDKFVEYYKSDGVWAKFFEQDPHYIGTDFYKGEGENVFLTIDSWIDEESYANFKKEYAVRYHEIDQVCENFTSEETYLGSYSD